MNGHDSRRKRRCDLLFPFVRVGFPMDHRHASMSRRGRRVRIRILSLGPSRDACEMAVVVVRHLDNGEMRGVGQLSLVKSVEIGHSPRFGAPRY